MARSPLRSRFTGRQVALAALCLTAVVLYAVFVPVHVALSGTPVVLAFLLGAVICAAPLLALTRPRTAIALFCGAAIVLPLVPDARLAATAPWPWSVPALLAFALFVGVVTAVHGARLGAFPLVIGAVGPLAAPLVRADIAGSPGVPATATADLIVTASVAVAAFLLAILIASRVRVGVELTQEREHAALEEGRRALLEERTRIARELHDVIAHSMSVIQVQASTARYRFQGMDDAAAREFEEIAATARTSLIEMRRLLGVLRTEDQPTELEPQKGVDDIPELVDTLRRAGVEAGLALVGADASHAAPPAVQIAAYRIVQEALSNAVRHAPDNPIAVHVEADGRGIRLRVRNPAPGAADAATTGHGLRGMQERAHLLGGTLTAGPDEHGTWEVEANLPVTPSRSQPPTPRASPSPEDAS
ncbi:histidine kinase [Microbacterium sp. 179-I 3D4 NHS]|uniref:histidine kinase n=1 Tax=Microbacterium sp. 179-I 3D4 NHS TaxID=3142381 RepID=UPI0039A05460